eukprot:CAMPEP_0168345686 /NCGR_PEP_ID=MMETSP0213-20121227/17733_1 /TAXON_ID=151035 /ORGANISM="Euplotes harpa, Strain FSP1.4" /LENGTH=90 /DNA_ID=CAMNT_0008354013 /DNA_START=156 /DNA_END=428 /DNA_ORIENTATION=+
MRTPILLGGIRGNASTVPIKPRCSLDIVEIVKNNYTERLMTSDSKLMYKYLGEFKNTNPQMEDDSIITDTEHVMLIEKTIEELRHQMALK